MDAKLATVRWAAWTQVAGLGIFFSMAPLESGDHSEKEKKGHQMVWHQKFRPERPRRTIHDG